LKSTPNFDPLAHIYRWLEWLTFGPHLERCRLAFLNEMSSAAHALILGDGDGRFTARLLEANSAVQVVAVDSSRAMLEQLVRRAGSNRGRVRTEQIDARLWEPGDAHFDLVVTHFFLDCFSTPEVEAIVERVRRAVDEKATWAISEFHVPLGRFGRLVAAPIVSTLYLAFRFLTGLRPMRLPEYSAALRDAGFVRLQRKGMLGSLLVGELWSFGCLGSKERESIGQV
jgi:ubiquinone/menaquinone biosynthesis C-methylase UbiE